MSIETTHSNKVWHAFLTAKSTTKAELGEALGIAKALDAVGLLSAGQKQWQAQIESELAKHGQKRKWRLRVNRVPHIYLIDTTALVYLGEICAIGGESGSGG